MLRSKPKQDIEVTKDGRVILRGQAYHKMRVKLCNLANGKCEYPGCGQHTPLEVGEAHHSNGRGGGKRDDRIYVNNHRNLLWYCRPCHHGTHVPNKVVPQKPTDAEFERMLGL